MDNNEIFDRIKCYMQNIIYNLIKRGWLTLSIAKIFSLNNTVLGLQILVWQYPVVIMTVVGVKKGWRCYPLQ